MQPCSCTRHEYVNNTTQSPVHNLPEVCTQQGQLAVNLGASSDTRPAPTQHLVPNCQHESTKTLHQPHWNLVSTGQAAQSQCRLPGSLRWLCHWWRFRGLLLKKVYLLAGGSALRREAFHNHGCESRCPRRDFGMWKPLTPKTLSPKTLNPEASTHGHSPWALKPKPWILTPELGG